MGREGAWSPPQVRIPTETVWGLLGRRGSACVLATRWPLSFLARPWRTLVQPTLSEAWRPAGLRHTQPTQCSWEWFGSLFEESKYLSRKLSRMTVSTESLLFSRTAAEGRRGREKVRCLPAWLPDWRHGAEGPWHWGLASQAREGWEPVGRSGVCGEGCAGGRAPRVGGWGALCHRGQMALSPDTGQAAPAPCPPHPHAHPCSMRPLEERGGQPRREHRGRSA